MKQHLEDQQPDSQRCQTAKQAAVTAVEESEFVLKKQKGKTIFLAKHDGECISSTGWEGAIEAREPKVQGQLL